MENLDGRICIVAGGAGFLGQHLIAALLNRRAHVVCVDNLSTGSMASVAKFSAAKGFQFCARDVAEPGFSNMFRHVDYVFNLASPASPVKYQADQIGTLNTNFLGARNLLDLATARNARFFQASTSEVYGNPAQHPQNESYYGNVNSMGIRACYDEGKRVAEALCFAYNRERHTDIRVARIFNTYGPGMLLDDGRAVSNFVTQALSGQDITIYGDGSQTRSFCYVDDLIKGILALTLNDTVGIGPVNLGNPEEITLTALAETICALTGTMSKIRYLELSEDDPMRRCPDISTAKAKLAWSPEVKLKDGLVKTIEHFRQVLDQPEAVSS